jgi:hypothetical protein
LTIGTELLTVKPSFEKGSPSRFRLVDEKSLRQIEAGSLIIPGKSAAGVI